MFLRLSVCYINGDEGQNMPKIFVYVLFYKEWLADYCKLFA